MCVIVPFTFSGGSTNSNLKVSQRHPVDQIIYHFIGFGQLLVFIGWHIWSFLFVCIVNAIKAEQNQSSLITKIMLYLGMAIVLVYIWILAATGRFGEIRWWPSGDHLSSLISPSIQNMTITKCRWTLLLYPTQVF